MAKVFVQRTQTEKRAKQINESGGYAATNRKQALEVVPERFRIVRPVDNGWDIYESTKDLQTQNNKK